MKPLDIFWESVVTYSVIFEYEMNVGYIVIARRLFLDQVTVKSFQYSVVYFVSDACIRANEFYIIYILFRFFREPCFRLILRWQPTQFCQNHDV